MDKLVVSLETAERLRAAKFPQKSTAKWAHRGKGWMLLWPNEEWPGIKRTLAAPTAQEIADRLPATIDGEYDLLALNIWPTASKEWVTTYDSANEGGLVATEPTMAEALAALWLKLNEQEATDGK